VRGEGETNGANVIEVLRCIEKYGERLDAQIAEETGVPLATVRERAADLAATGALITCSVTRFEKGGRVDGCLYRVSGYMPPVAPGRKARPKSAKPDSQGN
jgi:hypothetical protein